MNENNVQVPHDSSSAFDLLLYFWAKSRNTVRLHETYLVSQVLNFAIFAFFYQIAELNIPEKIYKQFIFVKFDTREMQNTFNEKQQF